MAAGATLRFSVEVAADQATRSMSVLSQAFNEAGISAKRSLLNMGSGTKAASEATSSLESKLKSFKGEMASGDRTINFFARSLNGIVPEASAAGQGLRLLADGLIGGLGVGFAIQATMAVLQLFGDSLKETERQAAESVKAAKETAEAWYQVGAQFDAAMAKIGAPKKSWQAEQVDTATAGTDKEIEAAEKKLRDVNADLNQALRDRDDVGLIDNGAEERVVAALAEKQAITETLTDLRTLRESQRAVATEKAEQAAAALTDASTAHTFYEATDAAREKAREAGRAREAAAKALADRKWWEEFNRQVAAEAQRIAQAEKDLATRTKAQQWMPDVVGTEQTGDSFNKSFQSDFLKDSKPDLDAAVANLRRLEDQMNSVRDAAGEIAGAFGAGVADLATGAQSAGKVIQSLARTVMQTVISMAMKSVAAKSASAAAGAAESQSMIPVVGPVLAAGAMSAMLAMVMGLTSKIPSAAGGWLVPKGVDPITQLHAGERVIPERYADGLDRLVEGGGRAAPVFNITTPDAESFYKMLKNRDSELFKVLKEGQRDRRFG
jgi:hypothetical protein